MNQPWMKFYLSDWCGDRALQSCSLAARGLWIEMLAIMYAAEPKGSLLINGHKVETGKLASVSGADKREVEKLFRELADAGVFSRDSDGTVFSRRMRRDESRANKKRENGSAGGNPDIRRGSVPKDERARRFKRSDSPVKAARIFAKSGGRCYWCKSPIDEVEYRVSQIVQTRDGGGIEEENLVASCQECASPLISNGYGRNCVRPQAPVPVPDTRQSSATHISEVPRKVSSTRRGRLQ